MSQFSTHPPVANIANTLQQALNDAIRTSDHTQGGIAERMNEALGFTKKVITFEKVRDWQNGEQDIPIHYLAALCWAVESIAPAQALLAPLKYTVVSTRAKTLEAAQATQEQINQARAEQQALLDLIGPKA